MDQLIQRIQAHLDMLVNEIGERPGGSPGCAAAENYISDHFARFGWEVERQSFACPSWQARRTTLRFGDLQLPAYANAYSPSCSAAAKAIPVGTIAELEQVPLQGNIGILYGDLVQAPLSPKSWFLKSDREDHIITLLERKQPVALITVQRLGGGRERLIEDWEFEIPSATVPAEVGKTILQAGTPKLKLEIDSHREPGETANIVGRSRADNYRVVICAHHDTKYDTPGAGDNASGVSILLTLAEILDHAQYPFALELVSFSNEEYMPIGDDEYLRRNGGDDLSAVIACINCDGVGQWLAPDSITAISAGEAFEAAIREVASEFREIIWADPWPESNHSTFAFRGVPSIAFTSQNRTALAHHPHDDLNWTDPGRIAAVIPLIQRILTILTANPYTWSRQS